MNPSGSDNIRFLAADQLFVRQNWVHGIIIFVVLCGVYIATMPHTVTLEDSGIFIMSCANAGISHPPGYPVHSIIGKLFSEIPIGGMPFRIHVFSAVFGAATCVLVWGIIRLLVPGMMAAYTVAFAYGVSRVFWSQAIIAEVYTLNTFLFFSIVLLLLKYGSTGRDRFLFSASLAYGLSLSHHWPLIQLSLPCLLLLLWPKRFEAAKKLHRVIPFVGLGLLPYLYLVLRSQMDPDISFYGPIDSLKEFLFFISRKGYAAVDFNPAVGWGDKILFVRFFMSEMIRQYTLPGALLAGTGFLIQWRRWPKSLCIALCLGFAGSSFFLIFLLQFPYEFVQAAVFRVYPLIPYGIMALWMGLAIGVFTEYASKHASVFGRAGMRAATVLLVFLIFFSNLGPNSRSTYTWAREHGMHLINSLEKNAVLFTHGDTDTSVAGYLLLEERLRPDILVYNDQGLVFKNRLFHPPVKDSERKSALSRFIHETNRTVYYTGDISHPFGIQDMGIVKKIDKRSKPGTRSFVMTHDLMDYCRSLLSHHHETDAWTINERNLTLGKFAGVVAALYFLTKDPAKKEPLKTLFDGLSKTYYGRLGLLDAMLAHGLVTPRQALEWSDNAETLMDDTVSKDKHSRLYYVRGHIFYRLNEPGRAIENFRRSIDIYADPKNASVDALFNIYSGQKDEEEFADLKRRIYGTRHVPERISKLEHSLTN